MQRRARHDTEVDDSEGELNMPPLKLFSKYLGTKGVAWSRCDEGHEIEMQEGRKGTIGVVGVDAVKQGSVSGAE